MKRNCFFLLLTIFLAPGTHAQKESVIKLFNASFEDVARMSTVPMGWYDCGAFSESPPDIQPNSFGVNKPPNEGNTYIGLVVRENETWEGVAQKLEKPLKKGYCYKLSLWLSKAENYSRSLSNSTPSSDIMSESVVVRIWGGNDYCSKRELLATSPLVYNLEWRKFNLELKPKADYNFFTIEAYYKTPTLFPYNGNVLIDNISDLVGLPCNVEKPEKDPVIAAKDSKNPKKDKLIAANTTTHKQTDTPKGIEVKILKDLDRKKIKAGQIISIDELYFKADSTSITPESYPVLNELFDFLYSNKDVVIEIGGHTNGKPRDEYCDRLSTMRAKAVADYLNTKGINMNRLQYKGYGKRKPIANNATAEGQRKNQRVEIKIIKIES